MQSDWAWQGRGGGTHSSSHRPFHWRGSCKVIKVVEQTGVSSGEMDLSNFGYVNDGYAQYSDYTFDPWSDGGSTPSQFLGV